MITNINTLKNNQNKGFSLIELSIVLIIIGLLVAGVTGGASLIKSAELRAVMSDLRNYQTAINAYYTATGDLPASTGSTEMDFANSCSAWAALSNEGIIDATLTSFTGESGEYACDAVTSFSADNSLTSKLKGSFYALGYNTDMKQNVIFVISGDSDTPATLKSASGTAKVTNSSITRKDAKFLDNKMDNGIIDSGKIFSFSAGTDGACEYDDTTTRDCAIALGVGL